jgi:hypothetical protein
MIMTAYVATVANIDINENCFICFNNDNGNTGSMANITVANRPSNPVTVPIELPITMRYDVHAANPVLVHATPIKKAKAVLNIGEAALTLKEDGSHIDIESFAAKSPETHIFIIKLVDTNTRIDHLEGHDINQHEMICHH